MELGTRDVVAPRDQDSHQLHDLVDMLRVTRPIDHDVHMGGMAPGTCTVADMVSYVSDGRDESSRKE